MGFTAAITAASFLGTSVVGNQQKQKAKGDAAKIERDAQVAQAAADAKLQREHDQSILDQSQAGAIARKKLEKPLAASPQGAATLLTPTAAQPIQRKTLLGQ